VLSAPRRVLRSQRISQWKQRRAGGLRTPFAIAREVGTALNDTSRGISSPLQCSHRIDWGSSIRNVALDPNGPESSRLEELRLEELMSRLAELYV
jgi:hypothetical protein